MQVRSHRTHHTCIPAMDPHATVQAFYDPNIVGSLLDLDTHKDAANRTSTVDTARVRLVRGQYGFRSPDCTGPVRSRCDFYKVPTGPYRTQYTYGPVSDSYEHPYGPPRTHPARLSKGLLRVQIVGTLTYYWGYIYQTLQTSSASGLHQ